MKNLRIPPLDDRTYNKFLLKKENLEREELIKHEDEYTYLYPDLDDPQFNVKIAERKEFNDTKYDGTIEDIKKQADILCNAEFELAPHQLFVRNFLSFQTPYNSLLLYHGLGTGKTCSAISVGEEMRDYLNQMGIVQRIIVVASPNVQENFKLQLFDERKLKEIDGLWNIRACTGNKYLKEINPMNMKGLSRAKVISQIKRIINNSYLFLGYIEFANYIAKKSTIDVDITDPIRYRNAVTRKLKKYFSNRLIIIDEVHNIRITDDNRNKRVAFELFKLVEHVDNLRLLLLSATPMYNSYKEVIWLLNLMNLNDRRATIEAKDVFDKEGNLLVNKDGVNVGEQLLKQKATGYISFVRGENPYTFPYRIFPDIFSPENTFKNHPYPEVQLNGRKIVQGLEHINIFLTKIGDYQSEGYNYIIDYMTKSARKIKTKTGTKKELPSFENMESFGYTMLQRPLESLNIVYPDERLNVEDIDPMLLVGKAGLNRIMTYTETISPPEKKNFEYKSEKYGRIFSQDDIGKYSSKIKNICDSIYESDGITLIYSQYIDGGVVPIALALEEMGFTRYGKRVSSLFKKPPVEAIDSATFKPRSEVKKDFHAAKYTMITGDKALSPDNLSEVKALTDEENKNGEKIKVLIISQAGSEGLDFKNIRQVHILEPWYNMNRLEQIIGRAVRTCSHKELPFDERNVEIFLYGTLLEDAKEAADLYVYRLAELKSVQIGRVSRILKESAVDCLLNIEQVDFTVGKIDQKVKQKLSNKMVIDYLVGDKPYSAICDYMESCSYRCSPDKDITEEDVKMDTYSESFIVMNTDKIVQRIRELFKDKFFYKKVDLIASINVLKSYPLIQINAALTQLIEDKNEYITDKYGRLGHLINLGEYYLFQPIELSNENISIFDRSVPIPYKREKLVYPLDEASKDIVKADVIEKEAATKAPQLIKELQNNYDIATSPQVIERGDDNWYKYCSIAMEYLHEEEHIDRDLLHNFLITHMMESLKFSDIMVLLDYFNKKKKLDAFEARINKYLESRKMKAKGLTGIMIQKEGVQQLIVLRDGEWKEAEAEDYIDLGNDIKQLIVPIKALNDIVGFMANFKKHYMVFKVKLMKRKRHKGARCDQAGKSDTLKLLNKIIGKNQFSVETTKGKNQKEFCIIQEFLLRYYDHITKDKKRWFLKPIEAVLIDLEKISL